MGRKVIDHRKSSDQVSRSRRKVSTTKTHAKSGSRSQNSSAKHQEIETIKAELAHFARTEWGQRWIDSMLHFGRPFRMRRGILYAQEDRVVSLTISPGMIFSTVQGTAPTPYRVKVLFNVIPQEGWNKIINQIATKAIYSVELLENKMPDDFPLIFHQLGYALYPPPTEEFNASCSCPDSAVPCKHIAATILYVALVLDFDPFLLLKLRGKDREEILSELKQARSCSNQPITKSIKNIREMVRVTKAEFDIPTLAAQDLANEQFCIPKDPYKIGFQLKPLTNDFEILESLHQLPNLDQPEIFSNLLQDLYSDIRQVVLKLTQPIEKEED